MASTVPLFEQPSVYKTFENYREGVYMADIQNQQGPFEIEIKNGGKEWWYDMSAAKLLVGMRMVAINRAANAEAPFAPRYDASVVPLLANSMFRTVSLSIGHVDQPALVSDENAYRGYLSTIVHQTAESIQKYETSRLLLLDQHGTYGDDAAWRNFGSSAAANIQAGGNSLVPEQQQKKYHVWHRRNWILEAAPTNVFFTETPLFLDCFSQQKLWPPNFIAKLTFHRHDPNFYIVSTDALYDFRIHIESMKLTVPLYELASNALHNPYVAQWGRQPIPYVFKRSMFRVFNMNQRQTSHTFREISTGVLPSTVYILFLKSLDYNGRVSHSPFEFQNLGVTKMQLRIDEQEYARYRYEPNFTNKPVLVETFLKVMRTLGYDDDRAAVPLITLNRFNRDYTIFPFDLTPDACAHEHLHEQKTGTLSLSVSHNNLTQAYTMLSVFVYNKRMWLDSGMGVTLEDI